MNSTFRRRVSIVLIWVLALTGSAAAFSACRHGDTAVAVTASDAHAAGHAAHAVDTGAPDSTQSVGAGCDCGCTCTGNCNHMCNTATMPPRFLSATQLANTTLPAVARAAVPHSPTHPPLRPPTASL